MNFSKRTAAGLFALALLPMGLAHRPHHHPPGHGPGGPAHELQLAGLNGTQLSLRNPEGWTKIVETDSSTRIHEGERTLTLQDLKVGMQLHEHDHPRGQVFCSDDVDVLPGAHVDGELVQVQSHSLTVHDLSGALIAVQIPASARIHSHCWPVSLNSSLLGTHVVVRGQLASEGVEAEDVDFPDQSHLLGWLALPAGLAMAGWAVGRGKRSGRHQPGLYD